MRYEKEPDYLECKLCESPCYIFDFKDGRILSAYCQVCGNDEVDEFRIPQD